MKNIIYILLVLLLSYSSFAQWEQFPGTSGVVYTIAYCGNNIFAGTLYYGVYISTNNGTNWTQTSLNNKIVTSLAVNGNYIYAGTNWNSGVYISTNNGSTWVPSLNNFSVLSIGANGNNVFAGTDGYGIYLSTNNGTDWNPTTLNNRKVSSLAVNGNNIFAGTSGFPTSYGVSKSTDNGTNWAQTTISQEVVHSLAVNGNNVFAGTSFWSVYKVYKSTDNGIVWIQTILNQTVFSFAINGNNIFAGTSNGVFVSNDNGANWTQRNDGLGNLQVNALCIFNNYIFAGTNGNSIYRRPLSDLVGIQPISNEVPKHFSLFQNYPNPFNPTTKIKFSIPPLNLPLSGRRTGFSVGDREGVLLNIYDILGRNIATLVNEQLQPGTFEVNFEGSRYACGVYFAKIEAGSYKHIIKMLLVK